MKALFLNILSYVDLICLLGLSIFLNVMSEKLFSFEKTILTKKGIDTHQFHIEFDPYCICVYDMDGNISKNSILDFDNQNLIISKEINRILKYEKGMEILIDYNKNLLIAKSTNSNLRSYIPLEKKNYKYKKCFNTFSLGFFNLISDLQIRNNLNNNKDETDKFLKTLWFFIFYKKRFALSFSETHIFLTYANNILIFFINVKNLLFTQNIISQLDFDNFIFLDIFFEQNEFIMKFRYLNKYTKISLENTNQSVFDYFKSHEDFKTFNYNVFYTKNIINFKKTDIYKILCKDKNINMYHLDNFNIDLLINKYNNTIKTEIINYLYGIMHTPEFHIIKIQFFNYFNYNY